MQHVEDKGSPREQSGWQVLQHVVIVDSASWGISCGHAYYTVSRSRTSSKLFAAHHLQGLLGSGRLSSSKDDLSPCILNSEVPCTSSQSASSCHGPEEALSQHTWLDRQGIDIFAVAIANEVLWIALKNIKCFTSMVARVFLLLELTVEHVHFG